MQHPVQALTTFDTLLITASNTTLNCFDLSTSTLVSTATPHTSLIRSLCCFTEQTNSTSTRYLISTGEDKQLIVSKLPSLELVSQRELVKRANALQVTEQGEIVVGDKFGDVYTFPLQPPPTPVVAGEASSTTTTNKKSSHPEYLPILGHVSMLNTLSLIPSSNDKKLYIATGDRDEHVRISRFPQGHVIEGFLFGSKSFVSSLLYVPPSSSTTSSDEGDNGLLLSAGGDSTIQIFKLDLPASKTNDDGTNPVGKLIGQYEIESLLLEHVKVAPVLPDPVPAGRKKDKKGKNKSTTTTTKEEEGEEEVEAATAAAAAVVVVEEEEKKELKTGLAVIKMLQIGTPSTQGGGILVLAAGSTALLYIPFSSLLSPSSSLERSHSILTFAHPILDFTPLPIPTSSTSLTEFLVSLDVTRPTSSSSSSTLVRVSLSQSTPHELTLLPPSTTTTTTTTTDDETLFKSISSVERTTNQPPSISSLYPVLMMLHHPGDESDFLETGDATVGDGKPKGGVRAQLPSSKKRTSSERQDADADDVEGEEGVVGKGKEGGEQPRKSGKRAVGRAETLRRWEEAKKKLEQGKGVESLSVGEKQAKEEMELESQQK
ncbi:hypothetical protein JCM5350_000401 [Sporobolomyces pararoseus]